MLIMEQRNKRATVMRLPVVVELSPLDRMKIRIKKLLFYRNFAQNEWGYTIRK